MNLTRFLTGVGLGLGTALGGGLAYILATDEVARGVTFGILMFLGGALLMMLMVVIFLTLQAKTHRALPPQISNHYRFGNLPAQSMAGGGAYYDVAPPASAYYPPQLPAGSERVFTQHGSDNDYGSFNFPPVSDGSHSGVESI